ncbi:MAG: protein kinase [Myxococcales bacterium]|nr:protein kinase [Myxococcales bacterium]
MLEQVIGRGRFELRATLGTGAFGTVFSAFDRERGHPVAIKRPHLGAADDLYRFKQEFRALADLSHPNLVTLFELFEDDGHWFFTMELIDGVPLTAALRRDLVAPHESLAGTALDPFARTAADTAPGSIDRELLQTGTLPAALPSLADIPLPAPPLPDLVALRDGFVQVGRALGALHAQRMLHRDIKPSNVLATPEGRVVVLDFGLVRHRAGGPDDSIAGTPLYMAPEPWLGEALGEAGDWYSFGVMLYEALIGAPPFRGTLLQIMQAKAQGAYLRPRERNPDVPADLDDLCCALLRPLAETRPRVDRILRALRPDEPVQPVAPPASGVFVGRQQETAALAAALALTDLSREPGQRAPAVVHLSGEPGIGKTALVQAFLDAQPDGAVVLHGRCHAAESVPFRALDAVVDELAQHLRRRPPRDLPEHAAALARVFPVLERVLGAPDDDPGRSPLAIRRRAFAALRSLLGRLAATAPVIVWIDDLQWGDADSAAVLHALLRPPDPPPMLVILSHRDDPGARTPFLHELAALSAEAGALPNVTDLALRRLDEADGRALVDALAARAPERRRARVLREAAGIPLLLDHLARAAAVLSDSSVGDSAQTDHDARDLLAEHVDRQLADLPPAARRLLALVAVADAPIALAALRDAADLPALDALKPLRTRRLVRLTGHDQVAPAFAQVAAIVTAGLDPASLRQHHLDLAGALELHHVAPRRVAAHYHAAGRDERAGALALQAARQADAALAFSEAADCYALALAWAPGDPAHARRTRRLLADALVNAGRCRESAEVYLSLVPDADPREAVALRRLAAEQLLSCGEIDRGEAELRDLARDQGLRYPASGRAALLQVAYGVVRLKLRGTRYVARAAGHSPRELDRIDTCLSASRNLSLSRSVYAIAFAVKGLRLALDVGEHGRIVEGLAAVGGSLALTGNADGRRMFAEAEALAESLATPRARGVVDLWRGFTDYGEGRWADARAAWDRAAALLGETPGFTVDTLRARIFGLLPLIHHGDYAEVDLRTAAGVALARATGHLYTEVTALMYSALPRLVAGDLEGARERVRESEARSPSDTWNSFGRLKLRVQCDLYAGDGAAALARLEAAEPEIEASRLRSFTTFRVVVGSLHAGAALQTLVDLPTRPVPKDIRSRTLKVVRRELGRFEDEPMGLARGLVELTRAGLADLDGDRPRAARLLESAAQIFGASDNAVEAACAARRLGQLLADPARVAAADAALRARGVAEPARWTACFAPGFANPDLPPIPR